MSRILPAAAMNCSPPCRQSQTSMLLGRHTDRVNRFQAKPRLDGLISEQCEAEGKSNESSENHHLLARSRSA